MCLPSITLFLTYLQGLKTKFSSMYGLPFSLLRADVCFPTIGHTKRLKCPYCLLCSPSSVSTACGRSTGEKREQRASQALQWRTAPLDPRPFGPLPSLVGERRVGEAPLPFWSSACGRGWSGAANPSLHQELPRAASPTRPAPPVAHLARC